jgi:hypothetical protein
MANLKPVRIITTLKYKTRRIYPIGGRISSSRRGGRSSSPRAISPTPSITESPRHTIGLRPARHADRDYDNAADI